MQKTQPGTTLTPAAIAPICFQANRAYLIANGVKALPEWRDIPGKVQKAYAGRVESEITRLTSSPGKGGNIPAMQAGADSLLSASGDEDPEPAQVLLFGNIVRTFLSNPTGK